MNTAYLQVRPHPSRFFQALGLSEYCIEYNGKTTLPFFTCDVANVYIDEFFKQGHISSDNADMLRKEAAKCMPANFAAVVELATGIKVTDGTTLDHMQFQLCETTGDARLLPHGYVTLVETGERVGPLIMHLMSVYYGIDILSFSTGKPYSLTGQQAILLFQQIAEQISMRSPEDVTAHIDALDEDSRNAHADLVDSHKQPFDFMGGIWPG